ncbi:hypothetical protein [uncultured Parasutterella sp.]|uniref:hypothetical protein n=1 Tax=uncultured Parasutterella sp. TaxID=1263098 RepID=UPI002729D00D|nr:hypothetical protein [uncultured Parasutterella sp.]
MNIPKKIPTQYPEEKVKFTSADKFMCWLAASLFALIFCWYKEPKLTDFLCTAMSMFCALFSAFAVAEVRDAKIQIEQKSSEPDSNTLKRIKAIPKRRISRREYRRDSLSVHSRTLCIKGGRRKKQE